MPPAFARNQSRLLAPLALLATVLGLLTLTACDYPEQGFFELAGVDANGKTLITHPFMVEEILDETELTLGFRILLPGDAPGTLAEAELKNSPDISRRGWHLAMADGDTGAGDFDLDIDHIDLEDGEGHIEFNGLYRPEAQGKVQSVSGYSEADGDDDNCKVIVSGLTQLPRSYPRVVRYVLRPLSQEDFERVLHGKVKDARRMSALAPKGLSAPHTAAKLEKGEQKPSHSAGGRP